MSFYLRSIDVYDHPISTSFSNSDGDQAIQASTALDFTMTHNYGSSDIAAITAQYVRKGFTVSFSEFVSVHPSGQQETNNVQQAFLCG